MKKKIYDVCHVFLNDGERCSILIAREQLKVRIRRELVSAETEDKEWWDKLFEDLDSVCNKLGNNQLEQAYIEV